MSTLIETLKSIDNALLLFINGMHSPFCDNVMMGVSNRFIWIPLYVFVLFLFVKKFGKNSWLVILLAVATLAISDQLASHLIKNLVMRYRPSHNLLLGPKLHIVDNYRGGQYGFVSSHAANTLGFAIFTSLLFPEKRWLRIVLLCWVALICYSRMYLGVHYPSDIIGGALVGCFAAFVTNRIWVYVSKRLPARKAG